MRNVARAKKEFDSYTRYAFSESELKRLLSACSDQNDRVMILIGSRYGIRREDIAKLESNNVDIQNSTVTYYEQKKRGIRTIPIEADVMQEIRILLNSSPKRKYLFAWSNGVTCWRHLQELCTIAGLPVPPGREGRPFHSLRGTCVKMRQAQGWSVNQVAALIGDKVSTVMQHYATTTPSELADLMQKKGG
jgi:integrase